MTGLDRQIAQAFVELTDTIVTDFDLIDFLHQITLRCTEVLAVDAAGLLLADHHGALNVVAASSEQARLAELFQLQNDEGPSLDCFRAGEAVHGADLTVAAARWPRFVPAAMAAGFGAAHALPLRLRDEIIGVVNLFSADSGELDRELADVGQALADVATIGILAERATRRREMLSEQLQAALNSRIVVEQAKGVLAERFGVGVAEAFDSMRGFARDHGRKLLVVARAVVDNDPSVSAMDPRSINRE
ncbi:GAF and ANTAR domain-containing protein [Amycolatopsis anabasis]|uniref:GAF and ANTAR domain-containing protein n=1 Tax=Amycolatopsis anabasis TaxID=1840409 RepID=UPI001C555891|nr:GAF and ANTAR domain-containing protein [Amycolatopsis anabasis]